MYKQDTGDPGNKSGKEDGSLTSSAQTNLRLQKNGKIYLIILDIITTFVETERFHLLVEEISSEY